MKAVVLQRLLVFCLGMFLSSFIPFNNTVETQSKKTIPVIERPSALLEKQPIPLLKHAAALCNDREITVRKEYLRPKLPIISVLGEPLIPELRALGISQDLEPTVVQLLKKYWKTLVESQGQASIDFSVSDIPVAIPVLSHDRISECIASMRGELNTLMENSRADALSYLCEIQFFHSFGTPCVASFEKVLRFGQEGMSEVISIQYDIQGESKKSPAIVFPISSLPISQFAFLKPIHQKSIQNRNNQIEGL
jgi:hypothetical protein